METDQDRHRTLPRELLPGASVTGARKCESPFIGHVTSVVLQFSDRVALGLVTSGAFIAGRAISVAQILRSGAIRQNCGYGPACLAVSAHPNAPKITYHRFLKGFSRDQTNVTVSLRHCSQLRNNPFKETAVIFPPRRTTSGLTDKI
jgi:hypothetical protein